MARFDAAALVGDTGEDFVDFAANVDAVGHGVVVGVFHD